MAFLKSHQARFNVFDDAATLRSVFNAAVDLQEDYLATAKQRASKVPGRTAAEIRAITKRARQNLEQIFSDWIGDLRAMTLIPELDDAAQSRVLNLAMILGSCRMSMYEGSGPLNALHKMKAATAQSPHKDFYHAAIDEIITEYTSVGQPVAKPEPSVADAEFAIILIHEEMHHARRLIGRSYAQGQMGITAQGIHPREKEWRARTAAALSNPSPAHVPETLRLSAQKFADKLRALDP